MRKSLLISLGFHAAVVAWAAVAFPAARDFKPADFKSVPVDIVTPGELTRIRAGRRDGKGETPAKTAKDTKKAGKAKKKIRKAKAVVAPPARAKPKPVASKAKPKSKSKPRKTARKKPPKPTKAVRKPQTKTKRRVTRRKSKKPKKFSADRISALLNKIPDQGGGERPKVKTKPKAPAKGRQSGQDATMSLSEIDAFRAQISQCWTPPVGARGADQMKVKLNIKFNKDGTLSGSPKVMNPLATSSFRAAAESAVRAVMQCQPYELPAKKFAVWRDMILNFDPRAMFGG